MLAACRRTPTAAAALSLLLCAMAAEATARATLRAVRAARGITTAEGLHLPAMADLDQGQ